MRFRHEKYVIKKDKEGLSIYIYGRASTVILMIKLKWYHGRLIFIMKIIDTENGLYFEIRPSVFSYGCLWITINRHKIINRYRRFSLRRPNLSTVSSISNIYISGSLWGIQSIQHNSQKIFLAITVSLLDQKGVLPSDDCQARNLPNPIQWRHISVETSANFDWFFFSIMFWA